MDKQKIQDYYFGHPKYIADKILFVKRDNRLELYREHMSSTEKFGNVWRGITGKLNGESISVIATGVGPSMVGDCVLALNNPDSICIFSGTCGGLDKKLNIGDYFLAEYAYRGDGYSPMFNHISDSFPIPKPYLTFAKVDNLSFESLKRSFIENNQKYEIGVSFTTSSVVLESDEKFWSIVSPNAKIIEMSCAPFYTAAGLTRKKAAAYFWVTDLPRDGKSYFDKLSENDLLKRQRTFDKSVSLDIAILSKIN